jgi:CubicO group peptidase (beta-lactamase class C family)
MPKSPAFRSADKLARALQAAGPAQAPAVSVAVANADGVLWSAAYGTTDLEFDVPASTAHSFRLGSVSKVVTTTAAAKLVSRGMLDLDRPISEYLLDLPEQHRATTMAQLLTHRGGVRHYQRKDYDQTEPGGAVYMRLYPANSDILKLFIDDPLVAAPGEKVSYTSYGYTLASMVMEAAAGQPFLELIAQEIARPFDLPSLAADDPFAVIPNRASGYMAEIDRNMLFGQFPEEARPRLVNGFSKIPSSNPAFCWAGAGFLMTPEDCARFGAALLDSPHSRISPDERELLFTPLTEADEGSPPLGLGWRVDNDAGGRLRWHHAGTTPGGRYGLAVYPQLGLSIALACNTMLAMGDVLGPASKLADVFA